MSTSVKTTDDGHAVECEDMEFRGETRRPPDTLGLRNMDPSLAYRWIRKQETNVARAEYKGWEIRRGGNERSVLNPHSGPQRKATDTDSTVSVGDLVLAAMPKEKAAQLRAENAERIKRRTMGVAASFRSEARDPHTGKSLGFEEHADAGGYKESVTQEEYDGKFDPLAKGRK